jgi:hypothetical protein
MAGVMSQRWTVSSEAGKAAGVPLALFVALTANAWHRDIPNQFDALIATKINAQRHGLVFSVGHALSYVASAGGAAILTLLTCAFMWHKRHDVVAVLALAGSVAIAGLVQTVSQPIVQRFGPHLSGQATVAVPWVFPAGHAAGFGALATMVALLVMAKRFPVRRPSAIIIGVTVAALVASFVRLLTGVQFMTDAAGGVALGAGVSCLAVALLPALDELHRRVQAHLPTFLRHP